jgi:hypothetical protein
VHQVAQFYTFHICTCVSNLLNALESFSLFSCPSALLFLFWFLLYLLPLLSLLSDPLSSPFLIIAFLHAEVLFQSRASQLLIALLLGWGVPGLHPNNSAQAACLHSTALPSVQLLPSSISLPRQKVEPVRERPINALLTSPGGDKESGVKK